MQQSATNSEQRQEPDRELATYARRMGAWALDFIGIVLPLILLIIDNLLFDVATLFWGYALPEPLLIRWISINEIVDSLTYVIVMLAIIVGYIIWWLFALRRGQTPGKQIVGIRVIKDDGAPSGWGYTFLREFVIKFLLVGSLSGPIFGSMELMDYTPSPWDNTSLLESFINLLLAGFISSSIFGIVRLMDYLWPLWDRKKKMQTLHDKLLGTLVVRNR